MLPRSPSGDCAQFHRHAPQCTHFSRSNSGAPSRSQRDRLARNTSQRRSSPRTQCIVCRSRNTTWSANPGIACTLPPISSASWCVTSNRPSNGISGQPRARHQRIVQRPPVCRVAHRAASFSSSPGLRTRPNGRICFGAGGICPLSASRPPVKPCQRHAYHAANKPAMKSIARVLRFLRAALHPTRSTPRFVGCRQILLRKRPSRAQQLQHRLAQLHAGRPRLVHAGASQHIG